MNPSTTLRQVCMLAMLPAGPRYSITVSEIDSRLKEMGMGTTVRTIQRDLENLSLHFPIAFKDGKPKRWSWKAGASRSAQPAMDLDTAVAFNLVDRYLSLMLPKSIFEALNPWFEKAIQTLYVSPKSEARWNEKLYVQKKSLGATPVIDPNVQAVLYECINDGVKARITYTAINREGKTETYNIDPVGIIIRDERVYAASRREGEDTIKLRALHRISNAVRIEKFVEICESIDLEALARQLSIEKSSTVVRLEMKISPLISRYLQEAPLSEDQTLEKLREHFILRASVTDSKQLRSWIYSLGTDAEVIKPDTLRQEIMDSLLIMAGMYCAKNRLTES